MATVDAVVVGAGHNGLVAANLLADAGWDVLVCEATDAAGGAVRSTRDVHPDYVTDLFSAFYPLSAASPVIQKLHLADHGLAWSHAPLVLAHVLPDDRCAVLSRDVDVTAASLDRFAPGDGDAWRRLAAQWDALSADILAALLHPFPPVGPALSLLRHLGTGDALRLARMGASSVRRFGEETFDGEGGPILLAGNALHSDLPPDGAGSALYGWLLSMLGQSVGFPVPVGGAGALIEALVARLHAHGGAVRLSAPVERVLVRGGSARGVRLTGGETVTARRAVLADVTAPLLYEDLMDARDLPARFRDDLRTQFQWDTPTLKLNWALRAPIPWTAAPAADAGTVHLGGDLDALSWYSTSLATKTVPVDPFILLGQMTRSDPTRSPAGTQSSWAYTHLPTGVRLTEEVVRRQVERVEALLERHAPGFGRLIDASLVQSPTDIESTDPSLRHGTVNGGTAQLHQQLVFRPVVGLGGADTPVDRLYLAGSSAHPGGGVHGGPGSNAARTALRRDGALGGIRRRAVRAAMRRIY